MRIKDDHPELFRQLHPTRNVGLDPGSVTNSSHRMLWWLCPAGHEWLESAFQRTSHMGWKNGDRYACLYCVAPGCVVNSCGHRKFRGGKNAIFRVLAHPCDKCEITEHARLILDAQAEAGPAAVRVLEDSPLYALFCSRGSEVVQWWEQLFPLFEAYFVRMVSLYIAVDSVQGRRALSWPQPAVLGGCMLRILEVLPASCQAEMQSVVPAESGHFGRAGRTTLPEVHRRFELGWALKNAGFDIRDEALDVDVDLRVLFLEQQRFSSTGEQSPVDYSDRHYPAFDAASFDREKASAAVLHNFRPMEFPQRITAVRVTLAESASADVDDPLGRVHVGYAPDLAPEELWERARGVWKVRADHVVASSIVLVVFDRRVVLVASISGLSVHRDGLAIVGTPLAGHPLIGRPDPLHTPNPLAHGSFDQGKVAR